MKLDRNINKNRTGKYALLNLRKNKIEWGPVGSDEEFFVIKLKDQCATKALYAYALEAQKFDQEWADEVMEMAQRAAKHPNSKKPD